MGSLLKRWVGSHSKDREIYHVTVMPCYDKKLEASRQDFVDDKSQVRDVDCVITASKSDISKVLCKKEPKAKGRWFETHF